MKAGGEEFLRPAKPVTMAPIHRVGLRYDSSRQNPLPPALLAELGVQIAKHTATQGGRSTLWAPGAPRAADCLSNRAPFTFCWAFGTDFTAVLRNPEYSLESGPPCWGWTETSAVSTVLNVIAEKTNWPLDLISCQVGPESLHRPASVLLLLAPPTSQNV